MKWGRIACLGMRAMMAVLVLAGATAVALAQGNTRVWVNGQTLTRAQLLDLQSTYGPVLPGCYWYDARSGLYGHCGRETTGVLRAGHRFAPLAPNASHGDTAVFINGRQLPMLEVSYLRGLFGSVLPGRYWLNGNGDYGFEGGRRLGNLFALARRASGPHRVYSPGSLSGIIGGGGNYCTEGGHCVYTNY